MKRWKKSEIENENLVGEEGEEKKEEKIFLTNLVYWYFQETEFHEETFCKTQPFEWMICQIDVVPSEECVGYSHRVLFAVRRKPC